jgi:hypothetical protein
VSAIEETQTAAAGKDTRAAGGVHPAPGLPHLPYGDAVHAALAEAGLTPDVVDAGLRTEDPRRGRELFLTLSWLPGHPDVDDRLWPRGMQLAWSHLIGWSAHHDTVRLLLVDDFAAPALLVDAVEHLATYGLDCGWEPADPRAKWEHARALDLALQAAAEREEIAW